MILNYDTYYQTKICKDDLTKKNIGDYLEKNTVIIQDIFNHNILLSDIEIDIYEIIFTGHSIFDKHLDSLPKSLKILKFNTFYDSIFNQEIKNLPIGIEKIILSSRFNRNVDYLPENLKYLEFGNGFNQQVLNLPRSIEILIFGHCFNQPVNYLPYKLKFVKFGSEFKKTINNLPKSLTHITMINNNVLKQELNNLPDSVEYINVKFNDLNSTLLNKIFYKLPNNLKILNISTNYDFDDITMINNYDFNQLKKKFVINKEKHIDKDDPDYTNYNIFIF